MGSANNGNVKKVTTYNCECSPPPHPELPKRPDNTCPACGGDVVTTSTNDGPVKIATVAIKKKRDAK